MICRLACWVALLFAPFVLFAERNAPPSKAELEDITHRGRLLAAYDQAAWHGTDALLATKPDNTALGRYIARGSDGDWTVAFGRLNATGDKFLIAYEALHAQSEKTATVQKYDPPREDAGFYLFAAKAIDTALADFRGRSGAIMPPSFRQASRRCTCTWYRLQRRRGSPRSAATFVISSLPTEPALSKRGNCTSPSSRTPRSLPAQRGQPATTPMCSTTCPKTPMCSTS